jgi:hypothetical protein
MALGLLAVSLGQDRKIELRPCLPDSFLYPLGNINQRRK